MKHLRIRTAALLLLAAGFGAVATVPAQADTCTDAICVYEGQNRGGTLAGFTTADNNFSNNRFLDGTGVNDRISSLEHRAASGSARFYTNSYWRGNTQDVPAGYWVNARYDNQYSSFRYLL